MLKTIDFEEYLTVFETRRVGTLLVHFIDKFEGKQVVCSLKKHTYRKTHPCTLTIAIRIRSKLLLFQNYTVIS